MLLLPCGIHVIVFPFFSFSSFERMLDSKLREEESNIRVLVPDVKLYK